MVETTTAHYGWTKPEVTKSASTWGGFLNGDLDSIDALVFANQQGIVPIGGIQMFGGAAAPANWLICDGRSLDTTVYAALFAVLQYAHGGSGANFNLPNLNQRFPLGAGGGSLGATGGETAHALVTSEMPAHNHTITINDPTHAHGVTDPTHNHSQTAHTHTLTDPGHAHTGGFAPSGGLFNSGVGPGIAQNTGTSTTGITIQGSGANINAASTGVLIQTNITGVTATGANVGGGAAHNNMPPFVALNFIIRFA